MTDKICPFMSRTIALTHPDDVRETYASFQSIGCFEGGCAAWIPEVTIDISPIKANPAFADMGLYRDWETDRKSTRLNSSHRSLSRMPSSA